MSVTMRIITALALALSLGLIATGGALADGVPVATAPSQRPAPIPSVLALTPHLDLPADVSPDHPLLDVIRKMWAGEFGDQPEWRLSLLIQGLRKEPRTARATAYSSRCHDGGGPTTRWGTHVRRGICAADPRYWGPGSVIWVDDPIYEMLIVEDTGSAVRGQDRFDICLGDDAAACNEFGVQRITYIPLYVTPPCHAWGSKPDDWTPPVVPLHQALKRLCEPQGTVTELKGQASGKAG